MTRRSPLKLFALLGFPLKHSLSSYMQNAAFEAAKVRAHYIPFEIAPSKLQRFLRQMRALPFDGFNVTIPHKEVLYRAVDVLDRDARAIGAVNTIVRRGAKLIGYNTDWSGFLQSVKHDLKCDPRGKSVALIGSGGAAKGCLYALLKARAACVVVVARNSAKAAALIKQSAPAAEQTVMLSAGMRVLQDRAFLAECDLVVNATSVGMKKDDRALIERRAFPKKKLYVYDLVYNPRQTRLVRDAKASGMNAVGGLGMLVYQGAAAFELWTGRKAPVAVMRRTVETALGK